MLLEMAAGGFGDRVAFTDSRAGASITYQQLYDAAGAAARDIRASGATRAAMLDVSNLAVPVALFAAGWAGVPYVPINYRLTAEEIDALLARVQPAYLVTDAERVPRLQGRDGVALRERDGFLAMARAGGGSDEQRSMDPDDVGVLLFTSGTTGAPKAAMLRHRHLVSYILSSVEFHSAAEEEAALVCVPPYHIAGIAAALSSVYAGRRVVQLPNFSADAWIDAARAERITTAFVVPTMLARIVAALEGEKTARMPHLQSLSYGGGKMPLPVVEKAMALFPDTDFTKRPTASPRPAPPSPCSVRTSIAPPCPRATKLVGAAWCPWASPCPAWKSKSAMTKADPCRRASAARSTCAVNRFPANTRIAAAWWTPMAGSPPATPDTWTRTATCSWTDAPTT